MTLLISLIFLSVSFYVLGDHLGKPILRYFFKPLTTLLVIGLALFQESEVSETYKYLILAGLVFSLIGDVFLMLPSDKFVHGLASFLVAHILFIIAFSIGFGPYFDWLLLIPGIIYSIVFLKVLLPKTGKLKIPVLIYSIVLLVFLWQAFGRFYYLAETTAFYTLVGAVLFIISDSILAFSHFGKKFRFSSLFIHFTYWAALVFLSISI